MSLLNISYKNNKYYLENKEIPSEKLDTALNYLQRLRVRKEKKIKVRENETLNSILYNNENSELVEKYKAQYKASSDYYKGKLKYELWRKNPKGFYNFITYLDNLEEETVNKAILADIESYKNNKRR